MFCIFKVTAQFNEVTEELSLTFLVRKGQIRYKFEGVVHKFLGNYAYY